MKCECVSHLQLLYSGDEMRELSKKHKTIFDPKHMLIMLKTEKILKSELKELLL